MLKCIVVDDSSVVRGVIVKILSNLGFEIFESDNGEDAYNFYQNNKGSKMLMIMDYTLPGMDGIDVLFKIRSQEAENTQRTYVILTSIIAKENVIEKALDMGADDYLMKPFDGEILTGKLAYLGLI